MVMERWRQRQRLYCPPFDIQRIQQDSQHLMVLGIHVVDSFAGQSHRYTLPSPDSDLAPLAPYRAYYLCALQVTWFQVEGGSSI
jgi:hypothetical protein